MTYVPSLRNSQRRGASRFWVASLPLENDCSSSQRPMRSVAGFASLRAGAPRARARMRVGPISRLPAGSSLLDAFQDDHITIARRIKGRRTRAHVASETDGQGVPFDLVNALPQVAAPVALSFQEVDRLDRAVGRQRVREVRTNDFSRLVADERDAAVR